MKNKKRVMAYVLAVVATGREYDIFEQVLKLKGVKEAVITYGLWDLVLKIEVDDLTELDKVISKIRTLHGIERTTTLIGV
ncbi:MAG: Lrp/AsnC ligand binding domain-containing protein [Thermoproteales archaeon]|nr:Lrp/AsnC ligand binding domain-containing protein [Thermoproteales archaeon]RLE64113.1 MAG: Lrp/AsnC family transcriptional regulator [Thermoprotei archaeon]